jgi:hypothetical protein
MLIEMQQIERIASVYSEIKYWVPMLAVGTAVIKGHSVVKQWVDKLFSNHLFHIEEATIINAKEAKQTNILLGIQSDKMDDVKKTLAENHDKEVHVWGALTEAIISLKEGKPTRRRKRAVRKKGER